MKSSSDPPSSSATNETPYPLPVLFHHTEPTPELLTQGAEALLYRTHFLTPILVPSSTHPPSASSLPPAHPSAVFNSHHPAVLKYRPSKPYRHPTLDKRLTRHRILSEARTLVKCRREGVGVPGVLGLDADGAVDNFPSSGVNGEVSEVGHCGGGQTGGQRGKHSTRRGVGEGLDGGDKAGEENTVLLGGGEGGIVVQDSLEGRKEGGLEVQENEEIQRMGDGKGGWMMMEYIPGRTVRETLQIRRARMKDRSKTAATETDGQAGGSNNKVEEQMKGLMSKIGRAVGRLHEVSVIHGDLTTSNMILRPPPSSPLPFQPSQQHHLPDCTTATTATTASSSSTLPSPADTTLEGAIILIDFGLATQSLQDEDKAVDLYVLERAFGSTHPEAEEGFKEVLRAYGESYKGARVVLKRLEEVRGRGRKRSMLG